MRQLVPGIGSASSSSTDVPLSIALPTPAPADALAAGNETETEGGDQGLQTKKISSALAGKANRKLVQVDEKMEEVRVLQEELRAKTNKEMSLVSVVCLTIASHVRPVLITTLH